jgi:hypothetical protein
MHICTLGIADTLARPNARGGAFGAKEIVSSLLPRSPVPCSLFPVPLFPVPYFPCVCAVCVCLCLSPAAYAYALLPMSKPKRNLIKNIY